MELFAIENWPLTLICAAMIVAAAIDGWKLKVPNWLTFPMVLSGWALGLCYNFGILDGAEHGGIGASLIGTFIGMMLLMPIYAIGGMGAGDVKMQMGFGAWIGAFYGYSKGSWIIVFSFCIAAVVGGILALLMMAWRGNVKRNLENTRSILRDWVSSASVGDIADKAAIRKPTLQLLPYGIPLCIGAVGYVFYYVNYLQP